MQNEPTANHAGPGYETKDANIRGVVIFAAGLFLIIAVQFIAMIWIFHYFSRTQSLGPPASPFVNDRPLPPQPRLQVEPQIDLEHLRDHENEVLHSYGWIDPKAGVVRMPIDHAMNLLIQKGLPVRAGQQSVPRQRESGEQ